MLNFMYILNIIERVTINLRWGTRFKYGYDYANIWGKKVVIFLQRF